MRCPPHFRFFAVVLTHVVKGEESKFIRYSGKDIKTVKKRADALLKALREHCELVREVSLRLVDDPKVPGKLLELEFKQVVVNYKFGVLYAEGGQVAEEEMFSNGTCSRHCSVR